MKKVHFLSIMLLLIATVQAQKVNKMYVKKPALGVHFTLTDFKTADLIRNSSLSSVVLNKLNSKPKQMTPGMAISYMQGLSNHVDVQARLAGSFLDLPVQGKPINNNDFFFAESDVSLLLKMVNDKNWVSPYISAGIGASLYKGSKFGAFIPVGAGIQVNFYNEAYLLLNAQYRLYTAAANNYHFFYSIGFAGNIAKPMEVAAVKPIAPIEMPKDTDGDGIFDKDDKCMSVAGVAKYQGCPVPDTDGDGINDELDKCINEAGVAKYQGCPIPDTDGDGVNDEEDKCVSQAGVARYNGCPVPDTDGDGVNDEEDKCKDVVGTAANQGCPVIAEAIIKKMEFAAKNVLFETGSAKLKVSSNKSLNEVVKILNDNKDLMLDIEGHTDNSGKADKNLTLSQSRATAVLAYLKAKGITEDRLTATGFGQEQPVADNKTAAGKQKNRRVELKLRSF